MVHDRREAAEAEGEALRARRLLLGPRFRGKECGLLRPPYTSGWDPRSIPPHNSRRTRERVPGSSRRRTHRCPHTRLRNDPRRHRPPSCSNSWPRSLHATNTPRPVRPPAARRFPCHTSLRRTWRRPRRHNPCSNPILAWDNLPSKGMPRPHGRSDCDMRRSPCSGPNNASPNCNPPSSGVAPRRVPSRGAPAPCAPSPPRASSPSPCAPCSAAASARRASARARSASGTSKAASAGGRSRTSGLTSSTSSSTSSAKHPPSRSVPRSPRPSSRPSARRSR